MFYCPCGIYPQFIFVRDFISIAGPWGPLELGVGQEKAQSAGTWPGKEKKHPKKHHTLSFPCGTHAHDLTSNSSKVKGLIVSQG